MPRPNRTHLSDLRGATRMALDAAAGITGLVERMHRTIQQTPGPLGRAASGETRGITGLVYRSVRGGMRLVGLGIDASLAPFLTLLPEDESTPARDAILSAVNGVYGDYLVQTDNPLAIGMSLRNRGRPVDLDHPGRVFDATSGEAPTGRLLVLVHGLCLNDLQWKREGHDHGAALERGGHWLDFVMDLSPYLAPFTRIGKARSAGITDLRCGTIISGAHVHVPLPDGVKCYAAAATLESRRSVLAERLVGDGLVPLDSALGHHADGSRALTIPQAHQWIGHGMGHLELLSRPEVHARLRKWMKA